MVRAEVTAFAHRLAQEAEAAGRTIIRVTVKLRFAPFVTQTRQTKLGTPGTGPAEVADAARTALDRFTLDRPVRLIGVGVEYTR
ncbi:hypothetical protein OIE66_15275 [Nonomuraea sp. NBC_01738]|uniref:DinB/UmuC family translesion DNA polymerase n=1 Tax=Nonomuraea sp. NBC_01738 TaxID=2976003 RepID=UPI002E0FC3FC|nr:hypothetical protein OIE66_15275 [Nonomuraea sp. NBC_01738]